MPRIYFYDTPSRKIYFSSLKTDREYAHCVIELIKELFGIKASLYERLSKSTLEVAGSSNKLISFLRTKGLPLGNKIQQGLDIPPWIYQRKEHV